MPPLEHTDRLGREIVPVLFQGKTGYFQAFLPDFGRVTGAGGGQSG